MERERAACAVARAHHECCAPRHALLTWLAWARRSATEQGASLQVERTTVYRRRLAALTSWRRAALVLRRCEVALSSRDHEVRRAHFLALHQFCRCLRGARQLLWRRQQSTARQHLDALAQYCARRTAVRRAAQELADRRSAAVRSATLRSWRRQLMVRSTVRCL